MIVIQNLFNDLVNNVTWLRSASGLPVGTSFYKIKRGANSYWYAKLPGGMSRYLGKAGIESIEQIVENQRDLKSLNEENRAIVRSLKANGIVSPGREICKMLHALANAGLFRLETVLIGTLAFQTYQPMLGLALKSSSMTTNDIDIAHSRHFSLAINDKVEGSLETILNSQGKFERADTFPDAEPASRWINKSTGLSIDFLAPLAPPWDKNRTTIEVLGEKADKIKFMDFLIQDAIPSAVVDNSGISVNVPMPERYAVHKIILSQLRRAPAKAHKDILQAEILINKLAEINFQALADIFSEALEKGPGWRSRLIPGVESLSPSVKDLMKPLIPRKYFQNKFKDL